MSNLSLFGPSSPPPHSSSSDPVLLDASALPSSQHLIKQNPKLSNYAIQKRIEHPELSFNLFMDPEGRAYTYDHGSTRLFNEQTQAIDISSPNVPPIVALQNTQKRRDRSHPEPTRAHKHEYPSSTGLAHSYPLAPQGDLPAFPQGNFRGCSPREKKDGPFQPDIRGINNCLMIVKPNDPAYRAWVKRSYELWANQENQLYNKWKQQNTDQEYNNDHYNHSHSHSTSQLFRSSSHSHSHSSLSHRSSTVPAFPASALHWASKFLRTRYTQAQANGQIPLLSSPSGSSSTLLSRSRPSSSASVLQSLDQEMQRYWSQFMVKYQRKMAKQRQSMHAKYETLSGFDFSKEEKERCERLKEKQRRKRRNNNGSREGDQEEDEDGDVYSDTDSGSDYDIAAGSVDHRQWHIGLPEDEYYRLPSDSQSDSNSLFTSDESASNDDSDTNGAAEAAAADAMPGQFYSSRIFDPESQWQNRAIHHVKPYHSTIHGQRIFDGEINELDRLERLNRTLKREGKSQEERDRILTRIAERIQYSSLSTAEKGKFERERVEQRIDRQRVKSMKKELKRQIKQELKKDNNRWMSIKPEKGGKAMANGTGSASASGAVSSVAFSVDGERKENWSAEMTANMAELTKRMSRSVSLRDTRTNSASAAPVQPLISPSRSMVRTATSSRSSLKPALPSAVFSSSASAAQPKGVNMENPILKLKKQQLMEEGGADALNEQQMVANAKRAQAFLGGKGKQAANQGKSGIASTPARGGARRWDNTKSRISSIRKPFKKSTIPLASKSTSIPSQSQSSIESRSITSIPSQLLSKRVKKQSINGVLNEALSDTSDYSEEDRAEELKQAAAIEFKKNKQENNKNKNNNTNSLEFISSSQSSSQSSSSSSGPDLRPFHSALLQRLHQLGIELQVDPTNGKAVLIQDQRYQAELHGIEALLKFLRQHRNEFTHHSQLEQYLEAFRARHPSFIKQYKELSGNASGSTASTSSSSAIPGPDKLNLRDALRIREIIRKREKAIKEANDGVLEELRRQEFMILERARTGYPVEMDHSQHDQSHHQRSVEISGEGELVAHWGLEPFWYEKRGPDFRPNLIAYKQVLSELDAHYRNTGAANNATERERDAFDY